MFIPDLLDCHGWDWAFTGWLGVGHGWVAGTTRMLLPDVLTRHGRAVGKSHMLVPDLLDCHGWVVCTGRMLPPDSRRTDKTN